jgi:predicted RNase H-like HicB family nuclease
VILAAFPKGEAPFKFKWSTGETSQRIVVKPEGEYCVIVVDAKGCEAKACFNFDRGEPTKCEVEINVQRTNAGVILVANVTGTRGKISYEWSNGETTQRILVKPEGKYCVYIKTEDGCEARACVDFDKAGDDCAVEIKADRTVSGQIVLAAYPKGSAPFKFEWSTGETTQRIIAKEEGEYCVAITDSEGCVAKTCIKVGDRPNGRDCKATIDVTKRDSTGVLKLTARAAGEAPFTYEWTTGETTESIQGKPGEKYCVIITDANGCMARACIGVKPNGGDRKCKVALKATKEQTGNSQVLVLTAYPRGGVAPFMYEWSNGETTESIKVDEAGVYCVTITDAEGCQARDCFRYRKPRFDRDTTGSDSCVVRIVERRDPNRKGTTLFAAGPNARGGKYEWSTGENTAFITVDKSGTYCVKVTFENGCVAKDCIDVKLASGGAPTNFEIGPNPVTDVLKVTWEADGRYDLDYVILGATTGSKVLGGTWSVDGNGSERIDVSSLRPGMYVINIRHAGGLTNATFYKR